MKYFTVWEFKEYCEKEKFKEFSFNTINQDNGLFKEEFNQSIRFPEIIFGEWGDIIFQNGKSYMRIKKIYRISCFVPHRLVGTVINIECKDVTYRFVADK